MSTTRPQGLYIPKLAIPIPREQLIAIGEDYIKKDEIARTTQKMMNVLLKMKPKTP